MENEEKLRSIKIVDKKLQNYKHSLTFYNNKIEANEFRNALLIEIEHFEEIRKDLVIAQIFKNRIRILERDNYKVIKVDIFSDVPGFVEEYNKIIDWNGDHNG